MKHYYDNNHDDNYSNINNTTLSTIVTTESNNITISATTKRMKMKITTITLILLISGIAMCNILCVNAETNIFLSKLKQVTNQKSKQDSSSQEQTRILVSENFGTSISDLDVPDPVINRGSFVNRLKHLGYSETEAKIALKKNKNDIDLAADYLSTLNADQSDQQQQQDAEEGESSEQKQVRSCISKNNCFAMSSAAETSEGKQKDKKGLSSLKSKGASLLGKAIGSIWLELSEHEQVIKCDQISKKDHISLIETVLQWQQILDQYHQQKQQPQLQPEQQQQQKQQQNNIPQSQNSHQNTRQFHHRLVLLEEAGIFDKIKNFVKNAVGGSNAAKNKKYDSLDISPPELWGQPLIPVRYPRANPIQQELNARDLSRAMTAGSKAKASKSTSTSAESGSSIDWLANQKEDLRDWSASGPGGTPTQHDPSLASIEHTNLEPSGSDATATSSSSSTSTAGGAPESPIATPSPKAAAKLSFLPPATRPKAGQEKKSTDPFIIYLRQRIACLQSQWPHGPPEWLKQRISWRAQWDIYKRKNSIPGQDARYPFPQDTWPLTVPVRSKGAGTRRRDYWVEPVQPQGTSLFKLSIQNGGARIASMEPALLPGPSASGSANIESQGSGIIVTGRLSSATEQEPKAGGAAAVAMSLSVSPSSSSSSSSSSTRVGPGPEDLQAPDPIVDYSLTPTVLPPL